MRPAFAPTAPGVEAVLLSRSLRCASPCRPWRVASARGIRMSVAAHVAEPVAAVPSSTRSVVDVAHPEQFDQILVESKEAGTLVLVDFHATW
jgi:thiol:disulfide interchange protein